MSLDEDCVGDVGRCIEAISHSFDDEGFYLLCRNPIDGTRLFGAAIQERLEASPRVRLEHVEGMGRAYRLTAPVE